MKFSYYMLLAIILSGCVGNTTSTVKQMSNSDLPSQVNTTPTESSLPVPVSYVVPYTVGGTYDSMSAYPTSFKTCLTAAESSDNIIIQNPQSAFGFDENQTSLSVEKALGISLSNSIGWSKFSTAAAVNYAKSSQDDAYTLNINYIYKYAGTLTFKNSVNIQGNNSLTPQALNVLSKPENFREMCGDKFVSQLDAGVSVLFKLTLKFNSPVEKKYYVSTLSKVVGLQNLLDIIKVNPNGVYYSVSASGIQLGGNPEAFNQIFSQYGGVTNKAGYEEISCGDSFNLNPSCEIITNQLLNYPTTIESQLTNSNNLYLSNPTVASWSSIGIYPGAVTPNQDVVSAMQELTKLYDEDMGRYLFVNNYQNMLSRESFLSIDMQQNLSALNALNKKVLSIYFDKKSDIMDCYTGFVSNNCLLIRDNIVDQRNKLLNVDSNLINLFDYLRKSQYLSTLQISGNDSSQCMLAPITNETSHLFLVNCNGQISGNFDTRNGLNIIRQSNNYLTVRGLNYTYKLQDGTSNQFSYKLYGDLYPDAYYSGTYEVTADCYMNNNKVDGVNRIFLTTMLY